ncbi:hypothetical protein Lesp02_70550 [Lentzea sp. NBRC 105346]|uniref:hypothetical protein n=1 Tax=Lentzea sp. NBRC 105346 TaxID=3032205 RepID=UPI0024A441BC|nr:hypothetical protein [Lentzea sp. NBRC 105346]GLZ34868.1 hypothetical protein Lesp02_70550 [Lentzea sp. NBRC 105346]
MKGSTLPDSFLELRNWAYLFVAIATGHDLLDVVRDPARSFNWVALALDLVLAAMFAADLAVAYLEVRNPTLSIDDEEVTP